MERMNPHTSFADLLTWPETTQPARSTRPQQPSDGIRNVMFGGQVTDQESDTLNKRKPCSGYYTKQMNGSGIFEDEGQNDESEPGSANPTPNNKTGIRMYQQALAEMSHVSFAKEEGISPKKPTILPEVAEQLELSGTLESEDAKFKKQLSNAKSKELGGHDIFAPPPQIFPRPTTMRALALKDSFDMGEPHRRNPAGCGMRSDEADAKTSKKINSQKSVELSGNNIFKGDVPSDSVEIAVSVAKRREMRGSDIFGDGKAEPREFLGGVRKPPGGESSIALV